MNKERKSPEIRFRSFESNWIPKKLKEVSDYFNGGSFEAEVNERGRYELITLKSVNVNGHLVSSGRYVDIDAPLLRKGTLVMILSEQAPGLLGVTATIPEENKYILNQRVAEIRPHKSVNSNFLSKVINANQPYFGKLGAGTKVQNISKPNVENYEFYCPNIEEQNKIGDFFENLDNLISLHKNKYEKLSNLKKAMLKKMFPKEGEEVPEIRFKGYTDSWVEHEIGDFYTFKNGLNKGKEFFGHGVPIVNFTDVFHNRSIESSKLKGKVELSVDEISNFNVNQGDILFTRTSETIEEIGYPSVIIDLPVNTVFSGFTLRARAIKHDPLSLYFKKYVFFTNSFRKEMIKKSSMTTRALTSGTAIKKMKFKFPENKKEQARIGEYFTILENLQSKQKEQILRISNIKKAMLQRMFV